MKSKKHILLLILLFVVVNLKFQCGREMPPTTIQYQFKEKVAITPYNLNYNVGDTVWLRVSVPGKKLFDEKTNSRIFFDSASINVSAGVELLYNNPFITTGPFATFIFPTGISANTYNGGGRTNAAITFGCNPSPDYNLLLGIVLIERGVFGISFIGPSNYLYKCFTNYTPPLAWLNFAYDVNDPHKQFYQQIPFSNIGKQLDPSVMTSLDQKSIVVINVQ